MKQNLKTRLILKKEGFPVETFLQKRMVVLSDNDNTTVKWQTVSGHLIGLIYEKTGIAVSDMITKGPHSFELIYNDSVFVNFSKCTEISYLLWKFTGIYFPIRWERALITKDTLTPYTFLENDYDEFVGENLNHIQPGMHEE